ncbi:hypothetical protein AN958_03302 [Leucoagaricus sp. SymC.cos]|nr:hypothetical protein AN958_03302 [Leucoagaricus sp. SymC.cos]
MSISQLDVRTLVNFRCVNRRALQLVHSIPSYKAIVAHAPVVLRGILSIEVGRWITCDMLYDELCTAECRTCGDFGGFLYILGTCKRVCYLCFSTEQKCYLPLSRREAMRKFGLSQKIVDGLPRMKSIPGLYTPRQEKVCERRNLVDPESARNTGIALHGSVQAMEQFVLQVAVKRLQAYDERAKIIARPRRPRTEDPFDAKTRNPSRFMAIVKAPWLDRMSQMLEWGFHCVGCGDRYSCYKRPLHWKRKFNEVSFAEHLKECGEIRYQTHYSRRVLLHSQPKPRFS